MAISISWTIEGERQLARQLNGISADMADLRVPFKSVAKKLKTVYEDDVFRTEGGAIRERWARLSPATIARKARSGGANAILIDTGKMKKSFRAKSGKDYAVIWNPTSYFAYHQSNKARGRLPRRVMLKLTDEHRRLVAREINTTIQYAIKKKR